MWKCRKPISPVLLASALALSLGVSGAQAASSLQESPTQGSAGFDGRPLLHQAVDRGSAQLVLASASDGDSEDGAKGERGKSAAAEPGNGNAGPAADRAAAANEPAAASAEEGDGAQAAAALDDADGTKAGGAGSATPAASADDEVVGSATETAATTSDATAAGDNPDAASTNAIDSAALAESGADASVSTASGIDAEAGAAATAEVTETDSGATAQADTTADSSVAVESEQHFTTKNKSMSKSITTKYGAISISRSTTHVVLEDGTRVSAKAHAMAKALATPGVTKTDTKTRADVRVQDTGGTADRLGSETAEPETGGTQTSPAWVESAAISEANAQ